MEIAEVFLAVIVRLQDDVTEAALQLLGLTDCTFSLTDLIDQTDFTLKVLESQDPPQPGSTADASVRSRPHLRAQPWSKLDVGRLQESLIDKIIG